MRAKTAGPSQRDAAGTTSRRRRGASSCVPRTRAPCPARRRVTLAGPPRRRAGRALVVGVQRLSAPAPKPHGRGGLAAVLEHPARHRGRAAKPAGVTEVSPWIYGLDSSGQIVTQYPPGPGGNHRRRHRKLRAAGMHIVPSLADVTGGRWSYQPVARVLHSPALMVRQIDAIAALVPDESLRGNRHRLRAAAGRRPAGLHHVPANAWPRRCTPRGRCLSVALFAKTSDAGNSPTNVAQDYRAIGQAADQVRLMGYDYHWTQLRAWPDRAGRLAARRAALRQDADPRRQDRARDPALRLRLVRRTRHGRELAAGAPIVAGSTTLRPRYDTRPQAPWFTYSDPAGREHTGGSRTRPVPGPSSPSPRAPGSAGSTCGCSVTRTPAPGPRCGRRCPSPRRAPRPAARSSP